MTLLASNDDKRNLLRAYDGDGAKAINPGDPVVIAFSGDDGLVAPSHPLDVKAALESGRFSPLIAIGMESIRAFYEATTFSMPGCPVGVRER